MANNESCQRLYARIADLEARLARTTEIVRCSNDVIAEWRRAFPIGDPVWLRERLDSAEHDNEELRDRLAKLEAALSEALDEWAYAAQYKGEHLAKKHGDTVRIAELRTLLASRGKST